MIRAWAFLTIPLLASGHSFELRGTVTGEADFSALRVQLFAVENPYTASASVDSRGEFRFRELAAGSYTVAVIRGGWGEVRRTVVISAARADGEGIVRADIPYTASEAAGGGEGVVSWVGVSVPEEARVQYRAAQKALERRKPAEAVRLLDAAVTLAPQFAAAWNALGAVAFQQGDAEAAERHFRRALEAEPGAFEPVVNLGGLLLRSGRIEEALAYNRRAAEARPRDALANAQLGVTYFRLERFDEAETYLLAARRADPAHHTQPQLFLAEIYRRRGDRQGAVRELEDLLARRPDAANRTEVETVLRYLVR